MKQTREAKVPREAAALGDREGAVEVVVLT
jgi:hypothetical protein